MSAIDNVYRSDKVSKRSKGVDADLTAASSLAPARSLLVAQSGPFRSWRIGPLSISMDYAIAVTIAVGAHVAIAFSGGKKPVMVKEVDTTPAAMTVQVALEPEEEDVNLDDLPPTENTAAAVDSFEPPRLVDVPSTSFDTTFVQPLQPSLPTPTSANLLTVPKGPARSEAVAGKIAQVFDLKSLDQIPMVKTPVRPIFPPELKRGGVTGEVLLTFIVDDKGDVRDVEVVNSSHKAFEAPAVTAVARWKFKPGRKGGRPVTTRMELPIKFSLDR